MKAVLLAAGRSTRLYPITHTTPKCLLEIGGKTMLEHQLDALELCGIGEAIIVVGYFQEMIRGKIAEIASRYSFKFTFVENPRFAETNNIYSLWTAKDAVQDSAFLVLHADVLFHPDILRAGAEAAGDIALVADSAVLEETMKLKLDEAGRVTTVGKHVSIKEASGTFLGLAKFSPAGGRDALAEVENLIEAGEVNAYFTLAVETIIKRGGAVEAVLTKNLPWVEIDFPEELEQAKRDVYPLIAAAKATGNA